MMILLWTRNYTGERHESGRLGHENSYPPASDGEYAIAVSDMRMPGMDGVEFLSKAKQKWLDTVRKMLTGNADQQTAVDAVNKGDVFRSLNKPCDAAASRLWQIFWR